MKLSNQNICNLWGCQIPLGGANQDGKSVPAIAFGGETSPFCFVAAYFNLIIIFNIVYHKFLVVSNPRYL